MIPAVDSPRPPAEPLNAAGRAVLDALAWPVAVLEADTMQVEFANRAARAGRPDQPLPCYALLYGRDRPCTPCVNLESLRTGRSVVAERELPGPGGAVRHVRVHLHPVLDGRGPTGRALEYVIDITAEHRAAAAARRTAGALKALSEFNQRLVRKLLGRPDPAGAPP